MQSLVILGFGGVGRAVLEQAMPHFKIALVADRSGFVAGDFDHATWRRIADAKSNGAKLASLPEGTAGDWRAAVPNQSLIADTTADETADILIECVQAGHRVALANKKPLCGSMAQFHALTATGQTRYEATVGAGLPVIVTTGWLRDTGDQIQQIQGCLSGTLGFVLSSIEAGDSYSSSVQIAKQRGWTEPDPRDDLGGVDVARKALILSRTLGYKRELSDIAIEPLFPESLAKHDVPTFLSEISTLDADFAQRQANAVAQDRTLRYVATITPESASVGLREVERNSPLGSLRGADNMVTWSTARYAERPLVVRGPGAGVEVTASAVMFDLLQLRT